MTEALHPSEGLTLRGWREADAAAVRAAFAGEGMAHETVRPVLTVADAAEWIRDRQTEREAGTAWYWAVVRGEELAGCVGVSHLNRTHGIAWISYWTVASARRTGVASAGLRTLADWCFAEQGLFRLELGHRVENTASCGVAMRAGFRPEGVERGKLLYGELRYDTERHARLATDPAPVVNGR